MELVEGEALKTRLDRGPLEVGEALELCRQVAEGLEAAHEKGIVHRDLKPGNILITPEGAAKILDFGLAKAYAGETTGVDIANSPTITARMTEPGVILGTAAYMSPEQARGRSVDKRSDIWAFGCILYECLTGKRAFQGETVSDTMALILKGEPDWAALPPDTPLNIATLLRRCLQKNPGNRLHDIADARIEIEAPAAPPAETAPVRRLLPLPWLVGGAAVMLLTSVLVDRLIFRPSPSGPSAPTITSTIKVEPGHWLDGMRRAQDREWPSRRAMAIAPDGGFLVYSAIEENPGPQARSRLYLRRMNQSTASPIAGTEGGINPFLSPDGRWVGFWADGKLKKVLVEGGVAATLCDLPLCYGASWGPDDRIAFSSGDDLSVIPAAGGEAERLTSGGPDREDRHHILPCWLPNGKAVLFTTLRYAWDSRPKLALLDLGTREWWTLIPDAADARYLPAGYLLFLRQGTLMAVRFDAGKTRIAGQPFPVVDDVMQAVIPWGSSNTTAGQFDVSGSGSLIYAQGGVLPDLRNSLVWVDHAGSEEPVAPLRLAFQAPRLSPDGRRIVYVTQGRDWQVFVYDLETGTNSRLTHEGMSSRAIWAPDGRNVVFIWFAGPGINLFSQPYDGSSPRERLTTSGLAHYPSSWTPDGRTLALVEDHIQSNISLLETDSGSVRPFLNSPFFEGFPEFSPDGRWIAYVSDESGRQEIYVGPFPGPGARHQVSSQGGTQPLWARDGKRLFFRWRNQVWAADVRPDDGFSTGKPRLLFEKAGYSPGNPTRSYDLSLDGRRFLMVRQEQRTPAPVTEMTLVQNWFEELKRMLPPGK
jgi:eukaryotic-like serine/threonine-protein kinase